MATELKLPELGENIESGVALAILVKPGDVIAIEDPVLEMETDKASLEVPSTSAGVVKEILISEGDTVAVGQPFLILEEGEGGEPEVTVAEAVAAAPSEPIVQTPEPAAASGVETTGAPSKQDQESEMPWLSHRAPIVDQRNRVFIPASPTTRMFAYDIGIDIEQVPGSGPAGRISIDDVKDFAKQLNQSRPTGGGGSASGPAAAQLPDFSKVGPIRRETMSGIRKATSRHMTTCLHNVPTVTQFEKIDITGLEAARKESKEFVKQRGGNLTITPILVKAVAAVLKEFPQFNASVDPANEEIVYKDYINIGVAVDTPGGLLVPVIRDADSKSVIEISKELADLSERARERRLKPDEMTGGTFTITNLGGMGGTNFTPVVNWPEVAILGLSRSAMEPVWNGSDFEPRLMMPLSMSYDHRLIDGADGMRFMQALDRFLSNPFTMALV